MWIYMCEYMDLLKSAYDTKPVKHFKLYGKLTYNTLLYKTHTNEHIRRWYLHQKLKSRWS